MGWGKFRKDMRNLPANGWKGKTHEPSKKDKEKKEGITQEEADKAEFEASNA